MTNENTVTTRKSTKEMLTRAKTLRSFGMTWAQVAGVLKEEGYTTREGGKPYGPKSVMTLYSIEKARNKNKRTKIRTTKKKIEWVETKPVTTKNVTTPESNVWARATAEGFSAKMIASLPPEYCSWQMQRCLDEAMAWRKLATDASTKALTK